MSRPTLTRTSSGKFHLTVATDLAQHVFVLSSAEVIALAVDAADVMRAYAEAEAEAAGRSPLLTPWESAEFRTRARLEVALAQATPDVGVVLVHHGHRGSERVLLVRCDDDGAVVRFARTTPGGNGWEDATVKVRYRTLELA